MSTCVICFEPIKIDEQFIYQRPCYIKCKNKSCTAIVCIDCMNLYVDYSMKDNQIPKCPNATCGRYYLFSDISNNIDISRLYAKCCFNQLLGKHGDTARKTFEVRNNIETLRKIRHDFINDRFPKAIAYTAAMIMPHKLRKLDKQVIEHINKLTMNTNRICMNLTCNGSLNKDLICLSCGTSFCLECEKRKGDNHLCNPIDIESVRAIKDLIHCPKCHLPIIKSEGCNNMTCANCGEKFLYNTGETGGDGGHVTQIEGPKNKLLLSVVYMQLLKELSLLDTILKIEALEPKNIDEKILINILINYYKNNQAQSPELELEIARAFEKYMVKLYINNRYHQALGEIESRLLNRTITHKYLQEILMILANPI